MLQFVLGLAEEPKLSLLLFFFSKNQQNFTEIQKSSMLSRFLNLLKIPQNLKVLQNPIKIFSQLKMSFNGSTIRLKFLMCGSLRWFRFHLLRFRYIFMASALEVYFRLIFLFSPFFCDNKSHTKNQCDKGKRRKLICSLSFIVLCHGIFT